MLKHLSMIAALVAAAACNSPHDRTSERDLRGVPHDLPAGRSADTTAMTDGELVQHAIDSARDAAAKFDARRAAYVERMHGRLDTIELEQPMLFSLADVMPLTDTGRTDVDAKLDHLANSIQQASLAVDRLDGAPDSDYAASMQVAREAMRFVDTARAQAWRAIGDARHGQATASGATGSDSWGGAADTGAAAAAAMTPST